MDSRRSFVLHVLCGLASCCSLAAADEPSTGDRANKVQVVIDYGDGVEKHFTGLPWQKGMTVFKAMEAAQAHRHGIRFEYRGQGSTALLTKIDDVVNEGQGRNWIFRINGKVAMKSFGIQELAAGDVVLWRFEEYR